MAASAASAASDDDADASSTCFICLEPHSGPGPSQRLLHGGCGCRGGSGFAHVACVAIGHTGDAMEAIDEQRAGVNAGIARRVGNGYVNPCFQNEDSFLDFCPFP